jgi:hypothetical protein
MNSSSTTVALLFSVAFLTGLPNGMPLDCNHNGVEDTTDITMGTSLDCQMVPNGIPDECDIAPTLSYSTASDFDPDAATGTEPDIIIAAQMNPADDSDIDLIVGFFDTDEIRVLINDGTGMPDAASMTLLTTDLNIHDLLAEDLDLDGDVDIVAVTRGGPNDVTIFLQDDSGANTLPISFTATAIDLSAFSMTPCDGGTVCQATGVTAGLFVDADAFPHLAVTTRTGLFVLTNDGAGAFSVTQAITTGNRPIRVASADVVGSSSLDLIVPVREADHIQIFPGDGLGAFDDTTNVVTIATGVTDPASIRVADIDGDAMGHLDLVAALQNRSGSPGAIGVYLNSGAGVFTETVITVGDEPLHAEVADLDGDGDFDIVSADSGSDALTVLHNDGSGTFPDAAALILTTTDDPRTVAIADLNADGVLDLASSNQGDDMVSVFTGTLTAALELDVAPENGVPDSCDNSPPVASCVSSLTLCPDGMGQAVVVVADVNDGSMDPEGDDLTLTLSVANPGPNYSDGEIITLHVEETSNASHFDECTVQLGIAAVGVVCPGSVPDVTADAITCMGMIPDITGVVTVTACTGSPTLQQTPAAGELRGLGPHAITIELVESMNVVASCMATVTVVDGTPPVITVLGDNPAVVECGDSYVDAGATGADACEGSTSAPESGTDVNTTVAGTYQVDYESMDSTGNLATASRAVEVVDTTDPVITCPVDVTLEANTMSCTYMGSIDLATGTDTCGGVTISSNAPPEFMLGNTVVTWTATDSAAAPNTDECTQMVTVTDQAGGGGNDCNSNDTIDACEIAGNASLDMDMNNILDECEMGPPVAICKDLTLNADGETCTAIVLPADIDNGSMDPDAGDAITLALSPEGPYAIGTHNLTLTVTDLGGLFDTCAAMLTVEDATAPTITCPPDLTIGANTASCGYTGGIGTATGTDCAAGGLLITNNAPVEFPLGSTTVTWTVSDGLTSSMCDQMVTVTDSATGGGASDGGGAGVVNFTSSQLTVPDQPLTVWSADLNGDTHIDLFTGHIQGDDLHVFFNNGAASFTQGPSIPTGRRPFSVAFGDFDEDGHIDLATANDLADTRHITIALNKDGTGSNFQAVDISDITLEAGTSIWAPSSIVAADFNVDLHLDLAVCVRRSHVMIYLMGDGNGHFTATPPVPSVGLHPFRMTTAAVNGDSRPDVVTANRDSDSVTPFRNDLPMFNDFGQRPTIFGFTASPHDIDAADMDGDGLTDLILPTADSDLFYTLRKMDATTWDTPTAYATGNGPKGLRVGDVNCDGAPDVVTANEVDNTISIHVNTSTIGNITFAPPVAVAAGTRTRFVTIADLDHDGDFDIVSSDRGPDSHPGDDFLTIFLSGCASGPDCDNNGVLDNCDIANNPSLDQNTNGIPDSCEGPDCNENGVPDQNELGGNDCNSNSIPDNCELDDNNCNGDLIPDECQLAGNDCDQNNVPDECQLAAGDCNNDGILDSCQLGGADCNANLVPDDCELVGNDCDGDQIPDECQLGGNDCNGNSIPDGCELTGNDCNSNSIPDDCELLGNDCNGNSTPDDCEIDGQDCNLNGLIDSCDIAVETSQDTGGNGVPDECEIVDCNSNDMDDGEDIALGTSFDCNSNEQPDECDLSLGFSVDCNSNNIPDACDIAAGIAQDCDSNAVPDSCDIQGGATDCDNNGVPDACEIATGSAGDCNENSIPDVCDIAGGAADCNQNMIPDECELSAGVVTDCDENGIPDVCQVLGQDVDCDANGIPDACEIASGTAEDCNANGVPDACDVLNGTSNDCDGNGLPDSCDIANGTAADCNVNGLLDACEIANGQGDDCNENGGLDQCDIASGLSTDVNFDGVPDDCGGRQVPGDCNQDGEIDIADPICLLGVLFTGVPERLPCGDGEGISILEPGNVTLMDSNGENGLDLSDGIGLLNWLFSDGFPHVLAVPGQEQSGCVNILGCPDNCP